MIIGSGWKMLNGILTLENDSFKFMDNIFFLQISVIKNR